MAYRSYLAFICRNSEMATEPVNFSYFRGHFADESDPRIYCVKNIKFTARGCSQILLGGGLKPADAKIFITKNFCPPPSPFLPYTSSP